MSISFVGISAVQVSKTLSCYEIAFRDRTPKTPHFFITLPVSRNERRSIVCFSSLTVPLQTTASDECSFL